MLKPPLSIFYSPLSYIFLFLIPDSTLFIVFIRHPKVQQSVVWFWWCQWQLLWWWLIFACNRINIHVAVVKTGLSGDQTLLTEGRIYERLTSSLTAATGGEDGRAAGEPHGGVCRTCFHVDIEMYMRWCVVVKKKKLTKKQKCHGIEVKVRDTKGKVPRGISPGVGRMGRGDCTQINQWLSTPQRAKQRENKWERMCVGKEKGCGNVMGQMVISWPGVTI